MAGGAPYFVPLTQSEKVVVPNHPLERSRPWQTPSGVSQNNLISLSEVEDDASQSVQRVNAGHNSAMFDMLAFDDGGEYLFIPHETPFGAGVTRYHRESDTSQLIFAGNQGGASNNWSADFGAFDPARWTPNQTLIVAEEWAGLGRVVELLKPMATPNDPIAGGTQLVEGRDFRILTAFARVSHEGIHFSARDPNKTVYFIDEHNSGAIYKLVFTEAGDYVGGGQTFVLVVDAFAGDSRAFWDAPINAAQPRTGMAHWQAMTDVSGVPLTTVNPFDRDSAQARPGRGAADEVGATPYGRPEDMVVGHLPNGHEVLYVTATSERAVYSVEQLPDNRAIVRIFASELHTPKNLGFSPTSATLDAPDNLALDRLGNVYIIEDGPNNNDVGGDIWFARDLDSDGIAESLDHFMSLRVAGAEATGMVFHPHDHTRFVLSVQHPFSTDRRLVTGGFGDAVWEFDVADAKPPACLGPRREWLIRQTTEVRVAGEVLRPDPEPTLSAACRSDDDLRFIQQLKRLGSPHKAAIPP